ncbi:intraflagellar transport protein 172 homolog [Aricia agestis]|uniref:intraflagellar transport protein 172 homolog n=1 Tax=Aricia agestis TaxID=91739 RepID=UPI001C207D38|nr:intraflagellar transport protein 172 homolog [Aricia agestis]
MRFKYSKTILEAQSADRPIVDLSWSPNNVKLAVATCDRVIFLYDRDGVRRDKFNTKPADPAAGKKSYTITAIAFSENSESLGVAQSDNMVFVYRVGADWSGKKVICNKFPLSGAPMRLVTADNGFYTGTSDGKIRTLDCKSNKSSSLWSAGSCCVSLARSGEAAASGHVDGALYVNGRLLLRYNLPPTVLALVPPYLIVGACDGRVCVYEAQRGALVRSVEPDLPPDRRDLITAALSPSGQTVAIGTFDGCLIGEVKEGGALELSALRVPQLYAAGALAWSADGTRLVLAAQTGALLEYEAVLRRWVWRDAVEVRHASPQRILLTRLAGDAPALVVTARLGPEIYNVRFVGNDWYAVCRTSNSLILCDIARGLTSEIPWSGGGERVYAAAGGACLLHRAGELSVVEYGLDAVLHTVRTERVNPHVLSVRINESASSHDADRKRLAYLLDRQTVAVVDLVTGSQLGQWWHEARVDWLELNEGGELLLLRDTRRRLALLRLDGDKEIIASGVSFVQWVENSDAFVAQTPTHLLIWYSAWETSSVEMSECGSGAVELRGRLLLRPGAAPLQLDEHRLEFNNGLRSGDLYGCASYLDGVSGADLAPLWRQLAERAMEVSDVQLAAKCYREVGDDARKFYLDQILELATTEGNGDVAAGINSSLVRAKLAIYSGDLATAEECYVKAGQPEQAIKMFRQYNRWTDAIALAEKTDRAAVDSLKQQYLDYLNSTGRSGEAGAALLSNGDARGAVRVWLRGGRARRAATALLQRPDLLRDTTLLHDVKDRLIQEEWWELAGELAERTGDSAAAVDYYAKGNNYSKAVQLAREACPHEVTRLEGEWGAWLASSRQPGAAVPHLIEAGRTAAALSAALAAHHYSRALQILQVIDDKESIKEECKQLGDHFISVKDWETAEKVLTSCGMTERCVRAYNSAGRLADGLRLAARLSPDTTRDIYAPLAAQLRQDGQLRKAEQIYVGLGDVDEAISMYKEAKQYDSMLRLVAAHRSALLEATRKHVAQALQASGDLRAAENYYIQAGDWKSAIAMYGGAGQWEAAERVARAHAPATVAQQTALQWAATLPPAPAARLLAARGLAAVGVRWALQAQRWDIANELSDLGGGVSRREVARHEAAALAADSPEAAAAAFVRAGAPDDAVRVWLARGDHQRALATAEKHAPHMVEEVLVEGARAAAERGDLQEFETLMIRANRPREVVQHYKDLELYEEASRVAREYVPDGGEGVPPAVPPLLQRAADLADRSEWSDAVRALCGAARAGAAGGAAKLAERAALRAARLARDRLRGQARATAAAMLADSFAEIGQADVGEQLRAALLEDMDEEGVGTSADYDEEEEAASEAGEATDAGDASELTALEQLARSGQWQRCLAHAAHRAPHYALRYVAHLFKTHSRTEGLDIESTEVPEALSAALEALRQYILLSQASLGQGDATLARAVAGELLVRVSAAPKAVAALQDAAAVLLAIGADDRILQAITLLMALHVPQVSAKAARALPRYTDIIVADIAFYMCGMSVRGEAGGAREAFVLLNHCLDLAEAADDDSAHMIDYTDFECTDWPRTPLLLGAASVRGAPLDTVRDWVLAVSMDQAVDQTLPVDERGRYAASVSSGEQCCVLTGYPLGSRLVTFANGRCANRESWSRAAHAARSAPLAAALVRHVDAWCGQSDFAHV